MQSVNASVSAGQRLYLTLQLAMQSTRGIAFSHPRPGSKSQYLSQVLGPDPAAPPTLLGPDPAAPPVLVEPLAPPVPPSAEPSPSPSLPHPCTVSAYAPTANNTQLVRLPTTRPPWMIPSCPGSSHRWLVQVRPDPVIQYGQWARARYGITGWGAAGYRTRAHRRRLRPSARIPAVASVIQGPSGADRPAAEQPQPL